MNVFYSTDCVGISISASQYIQTVYYTWMYSVLILELCSKYIYYSKTFKCQVVWKRLGWALGTVSVFLILPYITF